MGSKGIRPVCCRGAYRHDLRGHALTGNARQPGRSCTPSSSLATKAPAPYPWARSGGRCGHSHSAGRVRRPGTKPSQRDHHSHGDDKLRTFFPAQQTGPRPDREHISTQLRTQ